MQFIFNASDNEDYSAVGMSLSQSNAPTGVEQYSAVPALIWLLLP